MKLNKVKGYKTTTYEVESAYFKGFFVDIQETPDGIYAYLSHGGCGTKAFMFGAGKGSPAAETFMESLNCWIDEEIYKYLRENTHFEEDYREVYGWCDCDEEEE